MRASQNASWLFSIQIAAIHFAAAQAASIKFYSHTPGVICNSEVAFEIADIQPATCYEVPEGTVPWASWKPEVSSAEALAHSQGLIIRRWEDEKCEGTDANVNTPYESCSYLGDSEYLPKAVSFDWTGDEQPISPMEESTVKAAPLRNPDPAAIESSSVQTTSSSATTSQPPAVRTTTNQKTVYETVALRTEYVTGLPGKRRMRF